MPELPSIIKMNIAHYKAMLKTERTPQQRADIGRMLAEAQAALAESRSSEAKRS